MSDRLSDTITAHYGAAGTLWQRIDGLLSKASIILDRTTPEDLAPMDHVHGGGVEATRDLLDTLELSPITRLLDLGSGLGGPARYAAWRHGCKVEGVDLTAEFVAVANRLTEVMGLAESVQFHVGDVSALPFGNNSFERAMSQYVFMNIPDQRGALHEVRRVLKSGGVFAFSRVCAGQSAPIYPLPWALSPASSFLVSHEQTEQDVQETGFSLRSVSNEGPEILNQITQMRRDMVESGPPSLSARFLLGDNAKECLGNFAMNLEENRIQCMRFVACLA